MRDATIVTEFAAEQLAQAAPSYASRNRLEEEQEYSRITSSLALSTRAPRRSREKSAWPFPSRQSHRARPQIPRPSPPPPPPPPQTPPPPDPAIPLLAVRATAAFSSLPSPARGFLWR
ncbi:hypothetical protein DAI22_01g087908 [Oryza sativa Japonica Group]|nr:hypothetical protein DAI22_01g087908 [Oryza sativa Japonica Group]